jgi:hypothetical protein
LSTAIETLPRPPVNATSARRAAFSIYRLRFTI